MTSSTPAPDDIPDLADPGVKIVRHSFGGGSALFIVLGLFTLGALVTYKLSMDGNPALIAEEPAPAVPASFGAAAAKQTAEIKAALKDAGEMELVPVQDKPEDETRIHDAIDGAFRALDTQDANRMDMFLSRYGNHPYAVEKGYVETVRKAVATLEQQDAEEERKRKTEQQAVPWDMGVEPPKGQD